MTNEEKANQLHPYCPIYNDFAMEKQDVNSEVRTGFIEGANWKDQQFKEYLEKKYDTALNAWDDWAAYDPKTAESWRVRVQYIREIINELFGETEQDNSDREE